MTLNEKNIEHKCKHKCKVFQIRVIPRLFTMTTTLPRVLTILNREFNCDAVSGNFVLSHRPSCIKVLLLKKIHSVVTATK